MSLDGVCLGYGGPLATARWILADESRFHNGLTELRYHAQPISLYNYPSTKTFCANTLIAERAVRAVLSPVLLPAPMAPLLVKDVSVRTSSCTPPPP